MSEEFELDTTEQDENRDNELKGEGRVSFNPQDFLNERTIQNIAGSENFTFDTIKYKDLSSENQERVREKYAEVNADFEFVLIGYESSYGIRTAGKKEKILAIEDELKRNYKVSTIEIRRESLTTSSSEILVPKIEVSEFNFKKAANDINIKAIEDFAYLASILIIEPKVYCNTKEELDEELANIKKTFGQNFNIVPSFYNYLSALILKEESLIFRYITTAAEVALGSYILTAGAAAAIALAATNPIGWVALGILAFGLPGTNFDGFLFDLTEDRSAQHNIKRIMAGGFGLSLNNEDAETFKDLLKYNKNSNMSYDNFLEHLGMSDEIDNAIEYFVEEIYMKSNSFLLLNKLASDIKVGARVGTLLRSKNIESDREEDKNTLTIFSNEVIGNELSNFLNFTLSFPTISEFGSDEEDAVDVFDINDDGSVSANDIFRDFSSGYYQSGERVGGGRYLFDYQTDNNFNPHKALQVGYFDRNKDRLRDQNKRTIAYLKTLLDSMLEEAAAENFQAVEESDPELAKALGEQDVFSMLEDGAYPDIITPKDPILGKFKDSANRLPIDFYYFKPQDYNSETSEEEKEKGKRILNKSLGFIKNLGERGVVSKRDEEKVSIFDSGIFFNFGNLSYKNREAELLIDIKDPNDQSGSKVSPPGLIEKSSLKDVAEDQIASYIQNLKTDYNNQINTHKNELNKLRTTFGSKFGYENKGALEYFNESSGAVEDEKFFDLCEDSFLSLKDNYGMKKAFPTFRLYLVEEDAIYSDRLLAFDDFFYYNSVIGFNVHSDRELAASTATIQLQNISGLLDGTRKSVLRDIDLGNPNISQDEEEALPTIESVVLRKGVNVQLRAGYADNTNDLDVLISGAITEISYSGDNMTCNIVVQSYGIELDALKYGVSGKNEINNKFYTTHQLLGTLLLSPQLKHFGRVRTGKLFQTFESKIPSYDMETYTRASGWSFNWLNSWTDWVADYSGAIVIGSVLLSVGAGPLKTLGRALGKTTIMGKVGSGINAASTRFANMGGVNKVFGPIAGGAGNLIGRAGAFINLRISPLWQKIRSWGGKINLSKAEIDDLVKLADDLAAKGLTGVGGSTASTISINGINLGANLTRKVAEVIARSGTTLSSSTINSVVQTIIREELGSLAANFGWGASKAFAALGASTVVQSVNTASRIQRTFSWMASWFWPGARMFGKLSLVTTSIASILFAGGLIGNIFNTVINHIGLWFNESKKPFIRKILLAPQDDNLWCPRPETYLKRNNENTFGLMLSLKKYFYSQGNLANSTFFGIPGIFMDLNGESSSAITNDAIRKARGFIDERLDTSRFENEYIVTSQTFWEILHEMSLRHPGYIYGVRPYGNSMEYRVFFGLPGQRYFKKDMSNYDVYRLNNIFEKLSRPEIKELTSAEINLLFPSESSKWEVLNKRNDNIITKFITKEKYFTEYAFNEWLSKTKKRFVPFRQYHIVNSGSNLVANNIIVSGHNVNNTVSVHYSLMSNSGDVSSVEGTSVWKAVSNSRIPAEGMRDHAIRTDNIKGVANASRYATGALLYGAKKMYEGSLLILGNSKINTHDIIILNDNVNVMYGPVAVKAVTHMFSHQTGFVTDIEVEAVVTSISDTMTYPMLHQSVFFEARKELYEEYHSRAAFNYQNVDNEKIKSIIEDKVDEFVDNLIENSEDLRGIDLFQKSLQRDPETLNKVKAELTKQFIEYYSSSNKLLFQQDVIGENARLPVEIEGPIRRTLLTGAAATAGVGALEAGFYTILKRNGIDYMGAARLTQRVPFLVAATTAGVLLAGGLLPGKVRNQLSESLQSGWLGKNIFRPTVLSKIDNTNIIKVFPLVKDGRPLLAGGFENHSEEERFNNVLGNIYSSVSDGYKGFSENKELIEAYGKASVFANIPDWIIEETSETSEVESSVINYKLDPKRESR